MKYEKAGDDFIAYADGSAIVSSRKGGWAVVIYVGDENVPFSGSVPDSTNNMMELTAAIRALDALPTTARGVIRTDSNYVVQGVNAWRFNWQKNNWIKPDKKPVVNKDLWIELLALRDTRPKVRFQWVKGHSIDPGNILVDEMALAAARKL